MSKFKPGDVAYNPSLNIRVEIQDDGGFAHDMYLVKMLSNKKNKLPSFGMAYMRPEQLVPATELADAIFKK